MRGPGEYFLPGLRHAGRTFRCSRTPRATPSRPPAPRPPAPSTTPSPAISATASTPPQRMQALLAADPDCGMAHALKAAFLLLGYKQAFVPMAQGGDRHRGAADRARDAARTGACRRPRRLVGGRDGPRARGLGGHPGRPPARHPRLPPAPFLLVLARPAGDDAGLGRGRAAALERARCRAMAASSPAAASPTRKPATTPIAEAAGRAAIALDPGDLWAAHARGACAGDAGAAQRGHRLDRPGWSRNWEGGNNIMHHLWWHRAMYHLEQRDFDAVLSLYDTRFRDLASPVTQAQPDLYIDVQNAASMLFRLSLHGVDVGDRWEELADKAEARIGDTLSAFTLPHWMMALCGAGRWAAADRLLDGAARCGAQQCRHQRAADRALRAAGGRGGAAACAGRPCRRGRGDAAGAAGHVPARRQPRAAGRASSSSSCMRR